MPRVALIVAADEPALFFSSIERAERALEAIDVNDGMYSAAFGPDGEVYDIGTNGPCARFHRRSNELQPDALRALLMKFFNAVGLRVDDGEDLASLLARCEGYIGKHE